MFLLLLNGAITVGITIAAFRLFRESSEAMALWLLAASIIMLLLQAVDNIHVLAILSLSQQYARAAGPADLSIAFSIASPWYRARWRSLD